METKHLSIRISSDAFTVLTERRVLVRYNREGMSYYGLVPSVRRELLGIDEPIGIKEACKRFAAPGEASLDP